METTNRILVFVLIVFAVMLFGVFRGGTPAADLMALWLAGHFLAEGQMALVYPEDMGIFTMYAPDGWVTYLRASHGYFGEVYPFVYPPLWAWVSQFFAKFPDYSSVAQVALAINASLLTGSIWLGIRITRPAFSPLMYAGLAAILLMFTPIGLLALFQAQPQIFVSFLILLAIERSRAGAQISAGMALALAASIKLYPLLFVLFWLTSGQRRAVLTFVITGAMLAGFSILLTGWPLHQEFLHQISLMSGTVFIAPVSANLDGAIAQLFFHDSLTLAPALNSTGFSNEAGGWLIMHRPLLWSILGNLALVIFLGVVAWAFRRANPARAFSGLWPLALIGVALLAPFAWVYYFIPAAVLAPSLLDRLGLPLGGVFLAGGAVPILFGMNAIYKNLDILTFPLPVAVVSAMLIWALGFAIAGFRRDNSG